LGDGPQPTHHERVSKAVKKVSKDTLRRAYKRLHPDGRWFEKGAMRFFNTHVHTAFQATPDLYFFVSSEQYTSPHGNGLRKYSVRRLDTDGVETIGQFQQFDIIEHAENAAERLAKNAKGAKL